MAWEGGSARISVRDSSHPGVSSRKVSSQPSTHRTLLKGKFFTSPAGAAPLKPAQEGSQGWNWGKEELCLLDPNPKNTSVFCQMITSQNNSTSPLHFGLPPYIFGPHTISQVLCSAMVQLQPLVGRTWAGHKLGVEFWDLQELEGHSWLHRVYSQKSLQYIHFSP